MSKSHVEELRNVWLHLVKDACVRFPALRDEFDRDIVRLSSTIKQRGIGVFLVDLPALGKHLDGCLAKGEYSASGLPLSRVVSKAIQIPKFLRGMYLLIFDSTGCLKGDVDHEAVFFLRQLLYVGKKVSLPCPHVATLSEVAEFAAIDQGLPEPSRFWNVPHPSESDRRDATRNFRDIFAVNSSGERVDSQQNERSIVELLSILDVVSGILTSTLGPYKPEEWRFKHGPGAISDVKGPTNKYCWTNWSDRLESVFPIADYGFHNWQSWARNHDNPVMNDEPFSRLIAVRKTFTKPRLIAAEAREHQWCQQNCWDYFCSRVGQTWISDFISFRDQSLNQNLCLEGSRDGSLLTLDLSAASDRLTPSVVGAFFRHNPCLLDALRASRTRVMQQDISNDVPSTILLRKFSTMGSAVTFPVQSLVFLGLSISAALFCAGQRATPRNIKALKGKVAVFGDDIIAPRECRKVLQLLLEMLHFKVNVAKTFSDGKFRESCGVDAFRGGDVTPVYWKGELGSNSNALASTIECANNFYSKFLLHTASYVASTVRKGFPYVSMRSSVFGFKSRVPVSLNLPRRFNRDLQRDEVRHATCCSSSRRSATEDDTSLFQFFIEEPSPFNEWSHGVTERPNEHVRIRWSAVSDLE